MATEIVRYIWDGATGNGDGSSWENAYTSLENFQTAEAKDLIAADESLFVNLRLDSPRTSTFSFSGWVTDLTHNIHLFVPYEYRHTGKLETGTRFEFGDDGQSWPTRTVVEGLSLSATATHNQTVIDGSYIGCLLANFGNGHALRMSNRTAINCIILGNGYTLSLHDALRSRKSVV